MKAFLFISLFIFGSFCSCKLLEQNKTVIFDGLKVFTKSNLKKLFKDSDFEADTLLVSGSFPKTEVRKILGKSISTFFTANGMAFLDKEDFYGTINWVEINQDSVCISLRAKNKPYAKRQYPDN